jgi:hypothetical protein
MSVEQKLDELFRCFNRELKDELSKNMNDSIKVAGKISAEEEEALKEALKLGIFHIKKSTDFLDLRKKQIEENDMMLKELQTLSSDLHKRLLSPELNEQDKHALRLLLGYYNLVFSCSSNYLNFMMLDGFNRLLKSLERDILYKQTFIEGRLAKFYDSFCEMIRQMCLVENEKKTCIKGRSPVVSPPRSRKKTKQEEDEEKTLKQQINLYVDKLKVLFQQLHDEHRSLVTEFNGLEGRLSKLLEKSQRSTCSTLLEFMKNVINGGTRLVEFKQCLEDNENLKDLFEKIKTKFGLLETKVSDLFKKIRIDDISKIEKKRIEFDEHGFGCYKYITFRRSNDSFNQDLVQKALNLLLGSDTSTHEENNHGLILCQNLVAKITNKEESLQDELDLRDIIMYYSPSLKSNFPKGFPEVLLLDSTGSD